MAAYNAHVSASVLYVNVKYLSLHSALCYTFRNLIMTFTRCVYLGILFSVLFSPGCTTPDEVSKFCASSETTLASAKQVFSDMKGSCLRTVALREPIGAYRTSTSDPQLATAIAFCNGDIAKQSDATVAAVTILSDYFSAVNSLASFGTAKAGTDAQTLAAKTAAALGAESKAQTAIGSLASDLTMALTSGYQLKNLERDLTRASGNITDVTAALISIIQTNYVDQLLQDEENKTADRYREFYKADFPPEAKVLLEDRWRSDETAIQSKRSGAASLISSLQSLSKGFADLSTNAKTLKAKEIPALLEPYVTQMQTLIPEVQKAF